MENVSSHYHWPNIVERIEGTEKNFSFTDDRIIAVKPDELLGTGRHAAILEVAGQKLHIWAPTLATDGPTPRTGCIIYEGAPDELTRKKFRTALSFAFGAYLVETGHTLFDKDWRVVSATVRGALRPEARPAVGRAHPTRGESAVPHKGYSIQAVRKMTGSSQLDRPRLLLGCVDEISTDDVFAILLWNRA